MNNYNDSEIAAIHNYGVDIKNREIFSKDI